MKLISYRLNKHPLICAMPIYFNIMFKSRFPFIDSTGKIINANMKGINREELIKGLRELTKEHPVGWQLTVESRGKTYDYTAQNGDIEWNVRPN